MTPIELYHYTTSLAQWEPALLAQIRQRALLWQAKLPTGLRQSGQSVDSVPMFELAVLTARFPKPPSDLWLDVRWSK